MAKVTDGVWVQFAINWQRKDLQPRDVAGTGCGTTLSSLSEDWKGSQLHWVQTAVIWKQKPPACTSVPSPLTLALVHYMDEETEAQSWGAVPGLTPLWVPVSGGSLQGGMAVPFPLCSPQRHRRQPSYYHSSKTVTWN